LRDIISAFERGGMAPDTPAAIISSASTPEQHVLESCLGKLAADAAMHAVMAPAIVIVGKIAGVRAQLVANMVGGA
jgi:uroporphyrin-III C-methyltransferase